MPRNQVGFTSVNRQVTSGANSQSDIVSSIAQLKNKIVAGRVIDIILDDYYLIQYQLLLLIPFE